MSTDYGVKKEPQRSRLLKRLSDLGWHPWYELKELCGPRYGARILELKRSGYQIESVQLGNMSSGSGKTYRLKSLTPGEPQPKRVKAFIEPSALKEFLQTRIPNQVILSALDDAYQSYKANEAKL